MGALIDAKDTLTASALKNDLFNLLQDVKTFSQDDFMPCFAHKNMIISTLVLGVEKLQSVVADFD